MARYAVTIQDSGDELSERTIWISVDRDDQVIEEVRQWYGEDVVIIDWQEEV